MTDLQSKPLIELNLDTREMTITNNIKYIDIDKNIANIFLQIYREDNTGLKTYLTKEELDNFVGKIFLIKPVTNDSTEITGVNTEEFKSDNGGGVLRFIIPTEYTNRNGIVKCEIHINKDNESLTSDRFVFNVKQSLVTQFNNDLLEDSDFPILQQLILEIQKSSNIDDNNRSKITTYSSDKVENIKKDLNSQIKEIDNNKRDKSTRIKNDDIDDSSDSSKIGLNKLKDEVISAITGNAPVNQVLGNRVVNSDKIALNSVKDENLENTYVYGKMSKNLFNKNSVVVGKFIQWNTGNLGDNPLFLASDFIKVKAGEKITINKKEQMAFYDENKVYVSGDNTPTSPFTITIPDNVSYIRISVHKANLNDTQVEVGDKVTFYEEYGNKLQDNFVLSTNLIKNSISEDYLDFNPIYKIPRKNLIDKSKLKSEHYVKWNNGELASAKGFNATDFIKVMPKEKYTINIASQIAFYDEFKKYAGGVNNETSPTVLTVPENAKYIRISISSANINKAQLEKGENATFTEDYEEVLNQDFKISCKNLDDDLNRATNKSINDIINILENPFIRCNIKLIGDSITAGVGGTGYSPTGPLILNDGSSDYHMATDTSISWANMLKTLIKNKYSRKNLISVCDSSIKFNHDGELSINDALSSRCRLNFGNNKDTGTGVYFKFYGDSFNIRYVSMDGGGILDIYDGYTKIGELDTYSSDFKTKQLKEITGLSLGYHEIRLLETGRKNNNSNNYTVFLEGFEIQKYADVTNFGISGKNNKFLYDNREKLITADDDIVIIQMGTNDRDTFKSTAETYSYLKKNVEYALSLGCKVVLMCANPVVNSNDNNGTRLIKMYDINRVTKNIAREFNLPFISNYQAFLDYLMFTEKNLDDLLIDGLHPNDLGYKIMFKNITKNLSLSFLDDNVSY